jgi:RNA polymerase sigma-70 factor (ECF subfamily)
MDIGVPRGHIMGSADSSLTDGQLLDASSLNSEAFGLFYDRHAAAVFSYFVRRVDGPQTATDLAAETFAQAFLSRRRYRDDGTPATAWLFTIARRQLARFHRAARVEARARERLGIEPFQLSVTEIDEIDARIDREGLARLAAAKLKALPRRTRDAVYLRVCCQQPYAEVASQLNCSEVAARVRVSRGLARLLDELEAEACILRHQ